MIHNYLILSQLLLDNIDTAAGVDKLTQINIPQQSEQTRIFY